MLPNGRRVHVNSRTTNRLAARELRTQGKLMWEVGGADGEDEPKLAGAFFLGPPLPLMGQLYALAEVKGQEIRLVALSPDTGAIGLVAATGRRRFAGQRRCRSAAMRAHRPAMPTACWSVRRRPAPWWRIDLADALAACGAINIRGFNRVSPTGSTPCSLRLYPGSERRGNEHWVDGTITIADGRALVTPVESDQIYCLHVASGKELWKQDRDEHLYVACVHDGRRDPGGPRPVSAVNLTDGETAGPIWSLPSGQHAQRPRFLQRRRLLPAFDHGRSGPHQPARTDRSSSGRGRASGDIPGNLICFRDTIVSQGADYLDAYYQLDALKRAHCRGAEPTPTIRKPWLRWRP